MPGEAPADGRALRDALEAAQGRAAALEAEVQGLLEDLDAALAERDEWAQRADELEQELDQARRRPAPPAGESRELVRLRAQVHALQLALTTLTRERDALKAAAPQKRAREAE